MKINHVDISIQDGIITSLVMRPQLIEELRGIAGFIFADDRGHIFDFVYHEIQHKGKVSIPFLKSFLKKHPSKYDISKSIRATDPNDFGSYIETAVESYTTAKEIEFANEFMMEAQAGETSIIEIRDKHQSQRDMLDNMFFKQSEEREETINKVKSLHGFDIEPSRYAGLNKNSKGFMIGNYDIYCGRTGMGKTTYLINECEGLADRNVPVAILSYEMSKDLLYTIMACNKAGVSKDKILMSKQEIESLTFSEMEDRKRALKKYQNACDEIAGIPLYIFDISDFGTHVEHLIPFVRKVMKQHGIRFFFGDYIQLVQSYKNKEGRQMELSYISSVLKHLPKQLNIYMAWFAQVNRDVERRGGSKRPQLSDLRDSGSLEQDAFNVYALYRPEYYKILEDDEGNSLIGILELVPLKGRIFNKWKTVMLRFHHDSCTYFDADVIAEEKEKEWEQTLNSSQPSVNGSKSGKAVAQAALIGKSGPSKLNDDDDIPF